MHFTIFILIGAWILPIHALLNPSLPTAVLDNNKATRTNIQSGWWNYNSGSSGKSTNTIQHPIAYEWVQTTYTAPSCECCEQQQPPIHHAPDAESISVLLLNGFGMGSFHQHRLMRALSNQLTGNDTDISSQDTTTESVKSTSRSSNSSGTTSCSHIIYAMDYLGQGRSWPKDCNDGMAASEQGLRYCGETWLDQTIQFIEQVIQGNGRHDHDHQQQPRDDRRHDCRVHLVGNSVGGHLAVYIAAARPDLIQSITLLNATPVWGLNLPGWSGNLPAPPIPKLIGRYLFDRMRNNRTIQQFLQQTYVHSDAYDQQLIQSIQDCTDGPGGHAAFASILWSPPITVLLPDRKQRTEGFYNCLEHISCDVLLCYGRDDPWCKPVFAKRILQILQKRQSVTTVSTQRYIELTDVGHCPNHEAATATALVLSRWLKSVDRRPEQLSLLPTGARSVQIQEDWGRSIVTEREEYEIELNFVDTLATQLL